MKSAVALGLFDGVHSGHRKVIEYPVKLAERGFVPCVLTFSNATLTQKQGRSFKYIYTDEQKSRILKSLGIVRIFEVDFNNVKNMSGESFAAEFLANKLNAGWVTCGRDFRFGHNAACGSDELIELGHKYGFETSVADDVNINGEKVSSNKIRTLLSDGDVAAAARLLGDNYKISGNVVHGYKIGRTLNFPTINQLFNDGQLTVKYGVYASQTNINGKWLDSVTNVGVKPTIAGNRSPLAETYIIGFSGNLYDTFTQVRLIKFLRSEMKFNSLDELKTAMSHDIASSITILKSTDSSFTP